MDLRIAVAAQNFGADFQGLVSARLQRLLQPGQSVVERTIDRWQDREYVRARLLGLLEESPRPVALVGICIRPDAATLAAFRDAGVPVVLVDERAEGASTVACDSLAGGYLAGRHLAQSGRRSLAIVSGPARDYNAMQRVRGVAKALSEAGLPLPGDQVIEVPRYSREDGARAMAKVLALHGIDAIACTAGDACAAGLLAAARARAVKVPETLAVVGYDDAPLAASSDPPLTTVRQPLEAIAREVFRLATEETAGILLKPRTVLLEPELVVRKSA